MIKMLTRITFALLTGIFLIPNSGKLQGQDFNKSPEFLKVNSNWVFGDSAGLKLSAGSPVPFRSQLSSNEGCAAVSDPYTGKLLFYSEGKHVWTADHQLMPNGDSLLGNGEKSSLGITFSSAQGVCIVPVIDSAGKYYLFSQKAGALKPSLYYSVVDMNLNGGKGDVMPGRKNIILNSDSLSESMVAIPGNNCDIWLMVHSFRKPEFLAYHITKDGINPVPVVSVTGTAIQGKGSFGGGAYFVSWMAVSPDRTKIAITSNSSPTATQVGLLVGSFDANTGAISNAMKISTIAMYSTCFSPDNSKLYGTIINYNSASLYQFNLAVYDSLAIQSSVVKIGDYPNFIAGMRLYNDTIYVSVMNDIISRINQPNLAGAACNFQANAIFLSPNSKTISSLGSDVVFLQGSDSSFKKVMDTMVCTGQNIELKPATSAYSHYTWSNQSDSASLTVNSPGTYWVSYLESSCSFRTDTFVLSALKLAPIINVNHFLLGTTLPYTTYQWMFNGNLIPNATDSTYTVSKNGDYQVIVSNEYGCIDTSQVYVVTNTGVEDINNDTQIQLYPNPAKDIVHINTSYTVNLSLNTIEGKAIRQSRHTKSLSLSGLANGIYFLRIYDENDRLLQVNKVVKDNR